MSKQSYLIEQDKNQTGNLRMMKKSRPEKFDVIIIGGGAAGMSAALWSAELKLNALLLESKKELGGQLHIVHNPIENHLGATAENGKELSRIFLKQLKKRQFKLRLNAKVTKVNFKTKTVYLEDGNTFLARAIVIATGVKRRQLGIKGEEKFQNKGILESGKLDAEKVKGKTVCIVGGGDAALENAEILAKTAAKVYVIHRRKDFRARPEFIKKAKNNKKVEILMETSVVEILGEKKIEALELKTIAKTETYILPIDAILIRIGVSPDTAMFQRKLRLDAGGYIEINSNCETNIKNVFAIGDAANPIAPTVSSAVGMGATAAKTTFNKMDNVQ